MNLIGKTYFLKMDSFEEISNVINNILENAVDEIHKIDHLDYYNVSDVKVYFDNELEDAVVKVEYNCILNTISDITHQVISNPLKIIVELEK